MARSATIARTAGSWVGVVGTRSSSRSARRPSCARVPLESTIRRVLLRSRCARPSSRGRCIRPALRPLRAERRRAGRPPKGSVYPALRAPQTRRPRPPPVRWGAVAGNLWLLLAAREMSIRSSSLPPLPPSDGDAGSAVLISALETAPAAIYCLSADTGPVWANARARRRGTTLPVVDGRPVADLVDRVLRTGQPETLTGPLGTGGPETTVVIRPLRVAGGAGAL